MTYIHPIVCNFWLHLQIDWSGKIYMNHWTGLKVASILTSALCSCLRMHVLASPGCRCDFEANACNGLGRKNIDELCSRDKIRRSFLLREGLLFEIIGEPNKCFLAKSRTHKRNPEAVTRRC